MLEGPTDIADVEHKFIKIHSLPQKVKFKSFVNIDDNRVFMSHKFPDFFLVKSPKKQDVLDQYMEENKINKETFNQKIEEQVQGMGLRFMNNILKNWAKNSGADRNQIISIINAETNIPKKKLKVLLYNILKEGIKEKEKEETRKIITASTYRAFKELLCPVCLTFSCPKHTPLDPKDNEDDGQELKGFAYNPFILEDNFRKLKITSPIPLTSKEEKDLQETKTFQNIWSTL